MGQIYRTIYKKIFPPDKIVPWKVEDKILYKFRLHVVITFAHMNDQTLLKGMTQSKKDLHRKDILRLLWLLTNLLKQMDKIYWTIEQVIIPPDKMYHENCNIKCIPDSDSLCICLEDFDANRVLCGLFFWSREPAIVDLIFLVTWKFK